jgi:alanyl-tRNA synthetase
LNKRLFIIATSFQNITGGLIWTNKLAEYATKRYLKTTVIDLSKEHVIIGKNRFLEIIRYLIFFLLKNNHFVFIELCGGIHLDNTGEIGLFKIVSQEAAAAGIRRVEAIVGLRLFENLRKSVNIIKEISQILGTDKDLIKKVYDFQERLKELEKLHQETGTQLARIKANELVEKLKKEKLKIIAQQFDKYSPDAMRLTADFIRKDVNDCIGILYQKVSGKINYLIFVGQDIVKEHPANKLIKEISKILGGGGGGKPHMAEGGGGDPKRIPDAINYLKTKITNIHL